MQFRPLAWYRSSSTLIFTSALVVLGSAALVFGQGTGMHDADTALLAIMAKEKLTWFYWEQNRFGNLVPFATAWIRPIRLNLVAQLFLGSVAGFASIGFVMELAGITARRAEAFAVAVIVLMTCMRPEFIGGFFTGPVPYPVSCAMFYLGLRAARAQGGHNQGGRTAMLTLSAVLFWLAFFVNAALAAMVLPVLAFDCLLVGRTGLRPRLTLGTALFAAGAAAILSMLSGPGTPYGVVLGGDPLRAALAAMAGQFHITRLFVAASVIAAFSLACRGIGPALKVRFQTAVVIWALLASACLYACLQWVQLNGNLPRYYFVQVFAAVTLVACWMSEMLLATLPAMTARGRAILRHGLLAAALASILWVAGGVHGIRFVSATPGRELAINADMKMIARQVPGDRPAIVVGSYWMTVPIVFALLDRAVPRVFALTNHWQVMRPELRRVLASDQPVTLICMQIPLGKCTSQLEEWGRLPPHARQQTAESEAELASGGRAIIARY